MSEIRFKIDGQEITAGVGQSILDAATDNGVYIPHLCNLKGEKPAGSCRICTVKVNGRNMAACTTPAANNIIVQSETSELNDLRATIIEVIYAEGNHYCPACEKGGNCELQALAYKFGMMVSRFPYSFPSKEVDADTPKLFLDRNRCVLCKRCIRTAKMDGKNIFAFYGRGSSNRINVDHNLAAKLNDEQAQKIMDNCPVGSILKKEIGFIHPIGSRKYDKMPIGSDITNKDK